MSLFKRVFALLFLFLLLVIYCLDTHIDELTAELDKNSFEKKEIDVELVKPSTSSKDLIVKELNEKKEIVKEELQKSIELANSEKDEVKVEKKEEKAIVLVNKNIDVQKEINAIIEKKKIIFKRLSTNITDESYELVKKVSDVLLKYPEVKIEVAGHTDARGSDEVNEYISLQRAKSVRDSLIKYGISKDRIRAKGYGESMPIVENDKDGYSVINRRVEFNIIEE